MRKKILSLALASVVLAGAVTPASAYTNSVGAVNETQEVTEDSTKQCEVYAEVGSSYTVTIPKKITLDGATKTGGYTVSCTGDIAGDEYVSVTPDASFAMSQDGKDDVTASITQGTTKFRGDNYTGSLGEGEALMATGAVGAIDAQGLTAGAWNGTFNFEIALNTPVVSAD